MFAVSGRCQDGHREQGLERRADFVEKIFSTKKTPKRRLNIPTNLVNSRKKSKNPIKKSRKYFQVFLNNIFINSLYNPTQIGWGGFSFSQAKTQAKTLGGI